MFNHPWEVHWHFIWGLVMIGLYTLIGYIEVRMTGRLGLFTALLLPTIVTTIIAVGLAWDGHSTWQNNTIKEKLTLSLLFVLCVPFFVLATCGVGPYLLMFALMSPGEDNDVSDIAFSLAPLSQKS